jgi:hypothetical protein
MLSTIFGSMPVFAASNYNDENLITNVTVPSEGKISFKLKVPDWADSTYRIVYTYASTVQVASGTFDSNGTERYETVTVNVPHYATYTIEAGYGGYCTDEDSILVKMLSTHYTNKYTWTSTDVANYYANQFIGNFMVGGLGTLIPAKIGVIKAVAAGAGISTLAAYFQSGDPTLNFSKIPTQGYSWQFKVVPTTSGVKHYLSVWDNNNTKIVSDYYAGTTSYK